MGTQEDWRQLGLLQTLTALCALVSLKSKAELLYMSSQSVHIGSGVLCGNSWPVQPESGILSFLNMCVVLFAPSLVSLPLSSDSSHFSKRWQEVGSGERVLCEYEARSLDREVVKRCLSAWGDEPWVPFVTSVAYWSWVISSYLQGSSVLCLSPGRRELLGGFLRGQELFIFDWWQNWWTWSLWLGEFGTGVWWMYTVSVQ